MLGQRHHAVVHEALDDDGVELLPTVDQPIEIGIRQRDATGTGHTVREAERQLEDVVAVEPDLVAAVVLVQRRRVQVGHVGDVVSRGEPIPVRDRVPALGERLDRVVEEVRVAVRRNGRQEEDVGRAGERNEAEGEHESKHSGTVFRRPRRNTN